VELPLFLAQKGLKVRPTRDVSATSPTFLPVHRFFVGGLAAAFFALMAWATLAHIDIVVNVQGKLQPTSFVRIAQPAEDGVVRAVPVHDGQAVLPGQALVELDPAYAREDVRAAEKQRDKLVLQLARIDAELNEHPFTPESSSAELRAAATGEFLLRKQALAAALSEAHAAESKTNSERATVLERLRQAQQLLPLVSKQAHQQDQLRAQGFVSDAAATDKDKELVAARQELAAQQNALRSAEAAIAQARSAATRVPVEPSTYSSTAFPNSTTNVSSGLTSASKIKSLGEASYTLPFVQTMLAPPSGVSVM